MRDKETVNAPAVVQFVREVLGCNCPDEVFRQIEVRRGSTAVKSCPVDYELRIGGRLLVVVTSEAAESLSATGLQRVVSEGRRARDEGKFNRFRLVVRATNAAPEREKLLRSFAQVPGRDEKTHLHVVDKIEVPDFFAGSQPAGSQKTGHD